MITPRWHCGERDMPQLPGFVWLGIAIVAEVIATSTLRASESFSRLLPSLLVVIGYGISFYCLSVTLKSLPVGIVYAIWSGVGIVLVMLTAIVLYRQVPDLPAVIGIALIVAGVAVLNLFSKMQAH
jgi:small multidrug resistance pump